MTTTATAPPPVSRRRPSLRSVEDRNALTEANLKLARGYLARRFRRNPAMANNDDLFQAACLGVMRAAELYDRERLNEDGWPIAFSTFAEWQMRKEVNEELNNSWLIRVPRPRKGEITDDAARAHTVISLTAADDGRGRCYDPPAREVSEAERLATEQRWAAVEAKLTWAMERMGRAARRYLQAKCRERLSLREIAEATGVSPQRVKEFQGKVLAKMEEVLRTPGLFDREGG